MHRFPQFMTTLQLCLFLKIIQVFSIAPDRPFSILVIMAVEVNDSNFDTEVVEKSKKTPVLDDFWAEWCGPCRMIGPVLDKIEKDMNGKFILAKLDTDHNQKTAGRFRISGIPDVRLFIDGNIVDGFTGALPETHVKQFLDKNLPNPELDSIRTLAAKEPGKAAEAVLEKNIKGPIAEDILIKGSIHLLASEDENITSSVFAFLDAIPEIGSKYSDTRKHLIAFISSNPSKDELHQIKNIFNPDKSRESLEYFLLLVEKSSAETREKEKEKILACFSLLGNTNPLVNEYRKKLSAILF